MRPLLLATMLALTLSQASTAAAQPATPTDPDWATWAFADWMPYSRLAPIGDIDADGTPDLLAAKVEKSSGSERLVFRALSAGEPDQSVWDFRVPVATDSRLAEEFRPVHDVDGDGARDFINAKPRQGTDQARGYNFTWENHVVSGADLHELFSRTLTLSSATAYEEPSDPDDPEREINITRRHSVSQTFFPGWKAEGTLLVSWVWDTTTTRTYKPPVLPVGFPPQEDTYEHRSESRAELQALGPDGTVLWRFSEPNQQIVGLRDATGDGIPDILLRRTPPYVDSTSEEPEPSEDYAIALLDGSDGSKVWDKELPTAESAQVGWLGDMRGDGLMVFLFTYVAGATGTLQLLDGATGVSKATRTADNDFDDWDLRDLGDADGDGDSDAILFESVYDPAKQTSTRKATALDGGFRTLWSKTLPSTRMFSEDATIPLPDLDGDGARDLLFFEGYEAEFGNEATPVEAYSGRTGTQMYAFGEEVQAFFPVGDLDGDGGSDLLVVQRDERFEEGGMTVTAHNGAQADRLWSVRVWDTAWTENETAPEGMSANSTGDLDGDGVDDIVLLLGNFTDLPAGAHASYVLGGDDGKTLLLYSNFDLRGATNEFSEPEAEPEPEEDEEEAPEGDEEEEGSGNGSAKRWNAPGLALPLSLAGLALAAFGRRR